MEALKKDSYLRRALPGESGTHHRAYLERLGMARELSTLETLIRDRLGTAWSEDNQLFEQFYVYAKERGSKPKTNVIIRLVITKTGGKSLELGVNATLLDSPLFPSDAGEHVFNDL